MKLYITLFLLVLLCSAASLAVGAVAIPLSDVVRGMMDATNPYHIILEDIRLPRTLLALMVGGTLGFCGAAIQGYVRNPLAEPGLLGISSGASLGAVLVFYTGLAASASYMLPLAGMAGAMLAALCVWLLVGKSGSAQSFILAGMAVSSFAAAAVSVVLNLSPNPFAVMEIIFWLLGSIADRTMEQVLLVLPFMLAGMLFILSTARALDALSLGESAASSLGFSLSSVQWRLLLGISLMVGAAVSVAGVVGFVGLIVPHVMRPLVHYSPRKLLPVSALAGAILLLVADITVRLIPTSGTELKLGVVTALIGAPFFLAIVIRARSRMS